MRRSRRAPCCNGPFPTQQPPQEPRFSNSVKGWRRGNITPGAGFFLFDCGLLQPLRLGADQYTEVRPPPHDRHMGERLGSSSGTRRQTRWRREPLRKRDRLQRERPRVRMPLASPASVLSQTDGTCTRLSLAGMAAADLAQTKGLVFATKFQGPTPKPSPLTRWWPGSK
jgi:hypothetical protein